MKRNVYTGMDSFAERQKLARQHEASARQKEGMHEAKAISRVQPRNPAEYYRCEVCGMENAMNGWDNRYYCEAHKHIGRDEYERLTHRVSSVA